MQKDYATPSWLTKDNGKPFLVALLPCGLRNAFQQALVAAFSEYDNLECSEMVIEGNLNYEKSLYDSIDQTDSLDYFPDILISSDINSLYHKRFTEKYLNNKWFEETTHRPVHPIFQDAGYIHPDGIMNWFTANLLVMVADTDRFEHRSLPTSWYDILDKIYDKDLTLRGGTDFFCNAMLFPYIKTKGDDAIKDLGRNTLKGLHPSQMVKLMHTGNYGGSSVYVMPYSFAIKIKNRERYKIIFPNEGAIVSPVQMLIKKGSYEKHRRVVDFILGETMASVLNQVGFPSSNPNAENDLPDTRLNWIGWDFIQNHDISECKRQMQSLFFATYSPDSSFSITTL